MAVRTEPSRVHWWRRYADRIHRPPADIDQIMRAAARTPNPYPHIRLRLVHGKSEAYLPGTGLSVWEIVWLARGVHNGETTAVAGHLSLDPQLVEEALRYAKDHTVEIDSAVRIMEEGSEDRLRTILPGIGVVDVDMGTKGERTP